MCLLGANDPLPLCGTSHEFYAVPDECVDHQLKIDKETVPGTGLVSQSRERVYSDRKRGTGESAYQPNDKVTDIASRQEQK